MRLRCYSLYILSICCFFMFVACATSNKEPGPTANWTQPPPMMTPEEIEKNPGSMFNDANAQLLFADNRARRVGDIVMVKVEESTFGRNKADTKSERTSNNDFGVSGFFGEKTVSPIPYFNSPVLSGDVGNTSLFATKSYGKLDAKGETKRENQVIATVAARVVSVMPNGIMQIEGARETKVNDETQYLVVTGLVRASDVSLDNSISSSQIADAKIALFGKGVIADRQKLGWLTRLMDSIWPF